MSCLAWHEYRRVARSSDHDDPDLVQVLSKTVNHDGDVVSNSGEILYITKRSWHMLAQNSYARCVGKILAKKHCLVLASCCFYSRSESGRRLSLYGYLVLQNTKTFTRRQWRCFSAIFETSISMVLFQKLCFSCSGILHKVVSSVYLEQVKRVKQSPLWACESHGYNPGQTFMLPFLLLNCFAL